MKSIALKTGHVEPVSWKGSELDIRKTLIEFNDNHLKEIRKWLEGDINEPYPEAELLPVIHHCKELLESRYGFSVLNGLDRVCNSLEDYEKIACMIGDLMGTPVSQNKNGDKLVLVRDEGMSTINPSHRGHKTSDELGFHNDRCDIILLLCAHQSTEGGESSLVSAKYVHDHIQENAPEHLNTLYGNFPNHRRNEQRPGEKEWCLMPVFANVEQRFVCRFVKRFITDSQKLADAPRITPEQQAALDYMEKVINNPSIYLKFKLRKGQILVVNNHTILHGRSSYVDTGEHKRTLIRVWLSHPESRMLPESFAELYRDIRAGAVRGGI